MKKSASYKKQVLQGFKTAGNILFGLFTIVLLLGGLLPLSGRDPGRFGVWGDLLALVVAVIILYATAHSWSRWIGGFFGLPGVTNSLIVLSSGHLLNSPDKPVTRMEAASGLVFSILLIFFTYPLATSHRMMKVPDRLCLVAAVVAFVLGVGVEKESSSWAWMAVALSLFCVVWFRYRMGSQKHSHRSSGRRDTTAHEFNQDARSSESVP